MKNNINFIDLKSQYLELKDKIDISIKEVINSQIFINGPVVNNFENNFSRFCNTNYTIGCSSGTDALILSLLSLDIQKGDEVITTPFTFFATVEAIIRVGAKPVFVDICKKTFNIDYKILEEKITKKTKAIIPVHLYGQCANIKKIKNITEKYNISIIEDSAQSIGAESNAKKSGSLGELGCFSFFPTKNLGGFGDGGAVTTNSKDLYEKLLSLRQHGTDLENLYFYKYLGGNFRLDALQAAVLNVKLEKINEWNEKRIKNANFYLQNIKNKNLILPYTEDFNKHVYHQFTIKSHERDKLKQFLLKNGIPTSIYYPYPLHLQPNTSFLNYKKGDFPNAEKICDQVLSIPVHQYLTEDDVYFITETINKC